MAIVTLAELKTYFETGDKPTEQQFVNLIDTLASLAVSGSGNANITSITVSALQTLRGISNINTLTFYNVTNAVGSTLVLQVYAIANNTNVVYAIDVATGEIGTYNITADTFTPIGATPTLQQVLDVGNSSTTEIQISNGTDSVFIQPNQLKIANATNYGTIDAANLLANVTFKLPNKSAGNETFAMLSDITGGGDVYLANDQTFTGENTFAIGSGTKEPIIITKGGNGAGLKVTKSSGSGDAIEVAQGSVSIADETATTIASFDANKRLKSLATATYPSLTELSYVKGVGSDLQTQIDGKIANPMTTGGDIIYGGASGVPTRLANGSAGQVLQSNGTTLAPSWAAAPSGGSFVETLVSGATPVTGTTANTYSAGVLVPAGTFVADDCPFVILRINKSGTSNTVTMRVYANTVNSIAGSPILIGTWGAIPSTNLTFGMSRTMAIIDADGTGSGTTVISATTALQFDEANSIAAQSSLLIDWTVDQYIVVAIQNVSAGDSCTVTMLKIRQS